MLGVTAKKPVSRSWGTQRKAVESSFKALGSDVLAGHAIPLVAGLRKLAEACDHDPSDEKLWREYRAWLEDLREVAADAGPNDLDDLIDSLRASVGDGENPRS